MRRSSSRYASKVEPWWGLDFTRLRFITPLPSPAPAARPIRASGVVVSMNDTLGSIVVQHSGVPELNLSAGATSFRADPAVFKRTEVGDRISFDLTRQAGVYAITGTQPSPEP